MQNYMTTLDWIVRNKKINLGKDALCSVRAFLQKLCHSNLKPLATSTSQKDFQKIILRTENLGIIKSRFGVMMIVLVLFYSFTL